MLPSVINQAVKTNEAPIWFPQLYLASLIVLLALLCLPVPVAQAATITVTTTDDEINKDGDCSLREAILAANLDQVFDACPAGNKADTIILKKGEYILTRTGTNEDAALTGDLDLNTNMIISGAGRTKTIINGNGLDQVFEIAANRKVQISDVSVIGGNSPTTGGGLMIDQGGILILIDSTISGNSAHDGGGIFIDDGGTAALTNSWVNGNDAFQGGGINPDKDATLTLINSQVNGNTAFTGGGIFVDEGRLTLTNSQVSGNSITGSDGAGIYISYSSAGTLTNSQITGNTTDNIGGGLYVDHSTLTITGSQVSSNTALTEGGGISLDDSSLTIIGSQVSGNSGNGIAMDDYSTLMFTNGQISGNTAESDGGGIYNLQGTGTLVNSTVSGNSGTGYGGGIYTDGGTFNLYNVTITNNTANLDGDNSGQGGGIYIYPSGTTLTATNSIIAGNVDNSPTGSQHPDCSGPITNPGYNLIEDMTGCTFAGSSLGNITGVSPNLGPLQDNDGDTLTHALLAGSPAIDAGNPAGCLDQNGLPLATDQRNYIRPVDGNGDTVSVCDIGAYEYASPDSTSPPDLIIYLPLILSEG